MKDKVVKTGITVVSAVAFLLLGSCTSQKQNGTIFSSRGGHLPAPSVTRRSMDIDRSVQTTPVNQGTLLNNSGDGPGIIIDTVPAKSVYVAPQNYRPQQISKISYKVKKNESLWSIAHAHGISRQELARENGLSVDAGLKINQSLTLPAGARYLAKAKRPTTKPSKSAGSQVYKVKNGDSLSMIAWRYKTTVATLKSINKIKSNNIRIGQKLTIPNKNSARSGQGQSSTTKHLKATGNLYIVKKGDTLSEIAQNNGSSTKSIMKANGLKNHNIYIGKKLVIPGYKGKVSVKKPSRQQKQIEETLFKKDAPTVEDTTAKTPVLPVEVDPVVEVKAVAPVTSENFMDIMVLDSDTLESMAKDFGITSELILQANPNISGNKDLKPGVTVKIPMAPKK